MRIAIVDACGYETGEQGGKIEIYDLDEEMSERLRESENLLDFYNENLVNLEPAEVRSNDLDMVICV